MRGCQIPDQLGPLNAAVHGDDASIAIEIDDAIQPSSVDENGRVGELLSTHALNPNFGGRIAFVDDYDLHVAHLLVQGCDVWLNTPRKPLEASGTSGMKASMNGVLHLSIGDGWWAEGFDGNNGWIIDSRSAAGDHDSVDAADADALYALLENEIVRAFYERDARTVLAIGNVHIYSSPDGGVNGSPWIV